MLAACADPSPATPHAMPTDPPSTPTASGPCHADGAQFAIGRVLDAALSRELARRANAQRVRVLRPGEMSTMEFDEGRLTLELDASGRVITARCG